jgi:hypothetical protein
VGTTKKLQQPIPGIPLERVAFSRAVFCFRNDISEPTYHRLRAQGRGPREMRIGLNMIRITAEAEREWQQRMQEEGTSLEIQAAERAMKAGAAGARSPTHVSKRRRRSREPP